MKLIGKLSLVAAVLLSTNAMAYRIIDERTIVSPGATGHVETRFTSNIGDETLKKKPMYAETKTVTKDITGKVRNYVLIQSEHIVHIFNTTNKPIMYGYRYTLKCSNGYEDHLQHVELAPNEKFSADSNVFLTIQEERPGSHPIIATTTTDGEGSFSSSSSNLLIKN